MTFSLFWMLNHQAPTNLDVGVGLLTGPDRMEADIDWMDGTTSRAVMNRDYAVEHIYHAPGEYIVTVIDIAGDIGSLSVFPGAMSLTITTDSGNPMTAWIQTNGASGNMTVNWGDGTTSNVTGASLNNGAVSHTYATTADWPILVAPVGWPTVNGPIAQGIFTASAGAPTISAFSTTAVIGGSIFVMGLNLEASSVEHLYVGEAECLVPGWFVTHPNHDQYCQIITTIPSYCSGMVGKGPQDITVVTNVSAITSPAALAITG